MKSAALFLAGIAVGALITWFAFSKSYVLLPSGTTLVEVDRFNGNAREVFYSYEEANRLRREEDQRVEKEEEAWQKANTPAVSPIPEPSSAKEKKETPTPISAEELAQVKFTAKLGDSYSSPFLVHSFYNGTGKTLVRATVRVEGTRKDSNIPLARNVDVMLQLKPSTDSEGNTAIQYGDIKPSTVEGIKFTLVEVLGQ